MTNVLRSRTNPTKVSSCRICASVLCGMTQFWKKKSQEEIKAIVFEALAKNVGYSNEHALGVPASYLDENVFNQDASYLKEAPFLSSLIQNPNHIGCHTLGHSEPFFFRIPGHRKRAYRDMRSRHSQGASRRTRWLCGFRWNRSQYASPVDLSQFFPERARCQAERNLRTL
mgnify:CR=1 FL=1